MTAPTLTDFARAIIFDGDLVNATPQLLDADVTFFDAEGNFNGGSLTLSGLLAEDRVSVRNEGTGAGQIGLSGANVTYGGVIIGTLTGGVGTTLSITFNAAATNAAIDALIQNLTFAYVGNAPTGDRTLVLDVTDATGNDLSPRPLNFLAQTGAANPFNEIDVGDFSTPSFVDLDGDGDQDMVVGLFDGTLQSFANNGAGVFTQLTGAANPFQGFDFGNLATPSFVDLNGDGRLDLVAGSQSVTLRSFVQNPAGAFLELTGAANPFNGTLLAQGSLPSFGDIDGDGDMDAVVGSGDGLLRTFANNGAGVFTERTGAANPFNRVDAGNYTAPSFGDIDGDGDIDLVMWAGTLLTFVNGGAGTFTELTGAANPFDGLDVGDFSSPALVDLDGDGRLDLVVGAQDGTLKTFRNTGPGDQSIVVTVVAPPGPPILTGLVRSVTFGENLVNATPQRLDANVVFRDQDGDFNGGTLTLSGLLAEDRVSVFNQGSGAGQIGLSGTTVTYGGVAIGSLSGGVGTAMTITFNGGATSAAIDALIQNLTYANVSNAPTATRTLALDVTDVAGNRMLVPDGTPEFDVSGSGVILFGARNSAWTDLNGDGLLDVVVGFETGGLATLFLDSQGNLTQQLDAANPFFGVDLGDYSAPAFVDIDGDGDMDLVAGSVYGSLQTFVNDGAGGFVGQVGAANPFDGVDVGGYSTPSFVDIDGDGDMDAVIGNASGKLRTFANNGAGVFTERTGAASPFNGVDVGDYSAPSFGDIDGDGDMDLVVGEENGTLRTFANNGAGVFTELTGAANPLNGVDVGRYSTPSLVDFDGDGFIEIVVGNVSGELTLFPNVVPAKIVVNVTKQVDTFTGNGNNNSLTGSTDADVLRGLAGLDTLNGNGGIDTLDGGADSDWIYVDSATDIVVETAGGGTADRLLASVSFTLAGDDDIEWLTTTSQSGTVAINLTGNNLAQSITGNDGANILNGGGGNDALSGRAGADTLIGGAGVDRMIGGTGSDFYFVDEAGDVIVEAAGGGTADRVLAAVSFALAAGDDIELLSTTSVAGLTAINLTGNSLAQRITGNAGVNVLNGGGGNDILTGLAGADTLTGGTGMDRLEGGADSDWYYVDMAGDVIVEGAGGGTADRVLASASFTLAADDDIELLTTTSQDGVAAINLTGNNLAQSITGNAGVNVLNGGGGNDTLIARAGNDTLNGGIGDDSMAGGSGDDWYFIDSAGDVIVEDAGAGTDRVLATVSFVLAADDNIEILTTTNNAGTAAIALTGNARDQAVTGNAGANVLNGQAGADTLTGGAGADAFVFSTALGGGNVDRIADFSELDDTIQLDDAAFTGLAPGLLRFVAFAANLTGLAGDADDRIIYETDTGKLFFDVDGAGGTAGVPFARLAPNLEALGNGDFLIV